MRVAAYRSFCEDTQHSQQLSHRSTVLVSTHSLHLLQSTFIRPACRYLSLEGGIHDGCGGTSWGVESESEVGPLLFRANVIILCSLAQPTIESQTRSFKFI